MNNLSGDVKICGTSIGEVTVATTNADGSMRDLSDILADCRTAFAGLTESEKAQAAESLVGKNAMSVFLALMNAGEGDITKLSNAIANCDGTAAGMAETLQDNLAGQLTILKSQLEELAISFGDLLMSAIRTIVGWIQKFVDWLNSMDEGTRKVIVTVALVAAAIAALVAAFIYLWNNCEEFRQFWINLWEGIKNIFTTVVNAISTFLTTAWNGIKTAITTVLNAIKSVVTTVWNGIKSTITTIVNAIKNAVTMAWNRENPEGADGDVQGRNVSELYGWWQIFMPLSIKN